MIQKGNTKIKFRMAVIVAIMFALSIFALIPVSAETAHKTVTITTNSDINPFIRVGLHNRLFSSGGPFTIRCEVNVSQFTKTAIDGNVFYNIVDGRDSSQPTVWVNHFAKKTNGWIEMKDYDDNYIKFNNIDKVMISGVFEPFGLFQMGTYKAKAVVSFRNFRILNAAGKVVYSWDTDPGFEDLTNLKDFEGDTAFALTFGDGSAIFDVSDSGGSSPTKATTTTTEDFYVTQTTTSKKTQGKKWCGMDDTDSETTDTEPTDTAEFTDPTQTTDTTDATSAVGTTQPTSSTGGKGGNGLLIGLIIGGVVIVGGGAAFLILLKMNKLPWLKK